MYYINIYIMALHWPEILSGYKLTLGRDYFVTYNYTLMFS